MSSADVEAAEGTSPETDGAHEELLEALTAALDEGAVVGSEIARGDICVRVRADAWRPAVEACRDALAMDYFCFLSGIDWMPSAPNPEEQVSTEIDADASDAPDEEAAADAAEDAAAEVAPEPVGVVATEQTTPDGVPSAWQTGVAGGESRFQVFARLYSTVRHLGITLKADLDCDDPRVRSVRDVYRGADWHERETWEMYGFAFEGHPDLRHLYLPSEFEGHPLRKDFPLLAREVKPWPGIVDVEEIPEAVAAAQEAALMGGNGAEATAGESSSDAPAEPGSGEAGESDGAGESNGAS